MPKLKTDPKPREAVFVNIAVLLRVRGHNQTWLAERMNVTRATVSNWLGGRSEMKLGDLDRIAELLHTTPAKLYTPFEEVAENCTRLIC